MFGKNKMRKILNVNFSKLVDQFKEGDCNLWYLRYMVTKLRAVACTIKVLRL